MFDHNGDMFFVGGFMWLFWLGLIIVIVLLAKNFVVSDKSAGMNQKNPIEILKERYARGEIDETEFERRKKELES